MRSAQVLHRADQALRLARCTDGGPQVHHALGVGRHVASCRQQPGGFIPQRTFGSRLREVRRISQHTCEHALDVAVQNRHALSKAKGGHRCRSGAAYSRQSLQSQSRLRKLATVLAGNLLRAAVQISRARVIAQATPQPQHLVQVSGGQCQHIRKALQEAGVIVQHRAHLRLLQHDLGQPNAVRVAGVLPGQRAAAMLLLPDHQIGRKTRHQRMRRAVWIQC